MQQQLVLSNFLSIVKKCKRCVNLSQKDPLWTLFFSIRFSILKQLLLLFSIRFVGCDFSRSSAFTVKFERKKQLLLYIYVINIFIKLLVQDQDHVQDHKYGKEID